MRTSNYLLAAFGLFTGSSALHADVATFTTTEGKLNGTLQTIGKDGIIEWESPYAKEPLKLLTAKLEQIEFAGTPQVANPSPIQLTLRNGDILPATMVTALQEEGLLTETPIAGALTIPRAALASAQFGITKRNVIYSGFDNIGKWTSGKGDPDNWKRRGNALVSSGTSIAASNFDLTKNFVLNFELAWDSTSPNYSIGFADPLEKDPKKQDLYRFNFDSSGMRIMRHEMGQQRARTLAQWKRRPSEFPKKTMKVEIRVDRGKRQLELLINGQTEGVIIDPMESIPSGSGISISCQTRSSSTQTIRALTITELNDSRTRHLAEERGDASHDCIITTEDDRWSGELISLSGTPEERLLVFKTKFAEEAWEIPESAISTLFFANTPLKEGPEGEPQFLIEFHGKGKLTTSNCVITGEVMEATHPLLGPLQIQRSAIKSIRRIHKKS